MAADDQQKSEHGLPDDSWSQASGLSDLDKLLKALRERSGGSMVGDLSEIVNIAQRRHRYSGNLEQALALFRSVPGFRIVETRTNIFEARPS